MSETFEQTKTRLETFIKETYPQADIAPGSVLDELVVKLAASVQNTLYNEITVVSQQSSIAAAEASTVPTYSTTMDAVASNYTLTRIDGTYSTGKLKIIVSSNRDYYVPQAAQFNQPTINATYSTTQDYKASSTPGTSDLQLYSQSGLYYFILPVQADLTGSQYQVSSGSPFTLVTTSNITDFVSAEAYGNFTSGLSTETDQQLIARLKSGLSTRTLISPASIDAKLRSQFTNFQTSSVVGAGDAELLRASRNSYGFFNLGYADVYVRTSLGVETITVTKTATKTAEGIWTFTMGADDYPGYYKILSILPTTSTNTGTLVIDSQTYSYLLPTSGRVNSVTTAIDARFSTYQTCAVVFEYIETPVVAVGATDTFQVTVSYQPQLQEAQDLFLNDVDRIACADYLVRAVVPCFVSVNLSLLRNQVTDTLPVEAIKQDIFNYINTIPMGTSLYASKIVDICHNYNVKQVVLPIAMQGSILTNQGATIAISGTDSLIIPADVANGISNKTAMFFVDYYTGSTTANINIEVI